MNIGKLFRFKKENKKNEEISLNTSAKQQHYVTEQAEQFYKKPVTREDMVKNMRIFKEIPEDTSDPKVVIKLGDPRKRHKFVFMEDEDKRQYVIALPIDKKEWHVDIVEFSRRLYGKNFHVIGGDI